MGQKFITPEPAAPHHLSAFSDYGSNIDDDEAARLQQQNRRRNSLKELELAAHRAAIDYLRYEEAMARVRAWRLDVRCCDLTSEGAPFRPGNLLPLTLNEPIPRYESLSFSQRLRLLDERLNREQTLLLTRKQPLSMAIPAQFTPPIKPQEQGELSSIAASTSKLQSLGLAQASRSDTTDDLIDLTHPAESAELEDIGRPADCTCGGKAFLSCRACARYAVSYEREKLEPAMVRRSDGLTASVESLRKHSVFCGGSGSGGSTVSLDSEGAPTPMAPADTVEEGTDRESGVVKYGEKDSSAPEVGKHD